MNLFTILLVVVCLSFALRFTNFVATSSENNTNAGLLPAAQASEKGKVPLSIPADKLDQIMDSKKPRKGVLSLPKSYSATELEILKSLSKRRGELDKRDSELLQRQALLDAAEKQVDVKIAELKQLSSEIELLLNKQHGMQEQQLKSLVKIYESMKPKDAARIFDTLEMEILLEVLDRMSERKSAPIFAAMNAERAREVTIKLAGKQKLPDILK